MTASRMEFIHEIEHCGTSLVRGDRLYKRSNQVLLHTCLCICLLKVINDEFSIMRDLKSKIRKWTDEAPLHTRPEDKQTCCQERRDLHRLAQACARNRKPQWAAMSSSEDPMDSPPGDRVGGTNNLVAVHQVLVWGLLEFERVLPPFVVLTFLQLPASSIRCEHHSFTMRTPLSKSCSIAGEKLTI
jgi:hypothetical protein